MSGHPAYKYIKRESEHRLLILAQYNAGRISKDDAISEMVVFGGMESRLAAMQYLGIYEEIK